MKSRTFSRDEFASERITVLDEAEAYLISAVDEAIDKFGKRGWYTVITDKVEDLFDRSYFSETGDPPTGPALTMRTQLLKSLKKTLRKTSEPDEHTPDVVVRYLATATVNAATEAAAADDPDHLVLEWVSMDDDAVRPSHREVDGQRRELGEPFHLGEVEMSRPGDTTAPIEEWINCRCVLRADVASEDEVEALVAAASATVDEDEEILVVDALPWHGVLAPEGEPEIGKSGDKRSFARGALRNRDLPLPLTWQKYSDSGHKGNVVIGTIEGIYRHEGGENEPNEIRAYGTLLQTPEADEMVGLAAAFGRLGVSVDIDDHTFEFDQQTEQVSFTDARICAACVVAIPAFTQPGVQLGHPPEGFMGESSTPVDESVEDAGDMMVATGGWIAPSETYYDIEEFVSEKPWDGSASRFTDEQYRRSCILHKCDGPEKSCHSLPIREPNGALSRAGVHAAASRLNQVDAPPEAKAKAKAALRGAYKQLGEEPPDSLSSALTLRLAGAALEDIPADGFTNAARAIQAEFGRGPGWVTDPVPTRRIHSYWTTPGQPGYAKIAWGQGGDFNRCRVMVGKYLAQDGDARFINQTCAQWHFDALGYWPSTHKKMLAHAVDEHGAVDLTPRFTLVASAGQMAVPKAEWFSDPHLDKPTRLRFIEENGVTRVVGHLGAWDTCHLDFPVCVTLPPLADAGAHFMEGRVLTDQGVIAAGCLTLGGGHADTNLGLRAAKEHYDDVSTAVADVCVGEDEHGIWFAGWLRPWVTDQQKYELLAAKTSGDWRDVGGVLTLIAAHAVNTPGFGIVETHVEDGVQTALVAAGGFVDDTPEPVTPPEVEVAAPPQPDLADVVAAGIQRYEEVKDARSRIAAAAEQANATPAQRMERLKGD